MEDNAFMRILKSNRNKWSGEVLRQQQCHIELRSNDAYMRLLSSSEIQTVLTLTPWPVEYKNEKMPSITMK
eukprot:10888430-Karenia_brevis.AAC.1